MGILWYDMHKCDISRAHLMDKRVVLPMKVLLLMSIIATGLALTASVRPVASVPDFVGSFRSITLIGEARAQSRRDVRCRRGGYANNRYYCNLERARARGLVR